MVVLRLWICIKINHSTVMKIIAGNKNFNTFVEYNVLNCYENDKAKNV